MDWEFVMLTLLIETSIGHWVGQIANQHKKEGLNIRKVRGELNIKKKKKKEIILSRQTKLTVLGPVSRKPWKHFDPQSQF